MKGKKLKKAMPHGPDKVNNNCMVESPFYSTIPHSRFPTEQFHGFELDPREMCPENYAIFDQSDSRSQVMFNPLISHRFLSPGLNSHPPTEKGMLSNEGADEEDSEGIDALLSLEDDEGEEDDDVSTASSIPERGRKYKGRNGGKMKEMVDCLRGIVPGGKGMATGNVLDESVRYLKALKLEVQKRGIRDFPPDFGTGSASGSC